MTIGQRIREARLAKELTQQNLADLMGYTVVYVSNIERDVYKNGPSSRALMAFERVLGRLVK